MTDVFCVGAVLLAGAGGYVWFCWKNGPLR